MLAGLGQIPAWLRSRLPKGGSNYELFDLAVLVTLLPTLWYILGRPTSASVEVMSWLFSETTRQLWAALVSICGAIGVSCAYRRETQWGAAFVAGGCFMWCAFLVVGLFIQPMWAPAGTAILFGYLTRRAAMVAVEASRKIASDD